MGDGETKAGRPKDEAGRAAGEVAGGTAGEDAKRWYACERCGSAVHTSAVEGAWCANGHHAAQAWTVMPSWLVVDVDGHGWRGRVALGALARLRTSATDTKAHPGHPGHPGHPDNEAGRAGREGA